MPLPSNKRDLLTSLQTAYDRLVEELAAVPPALERDPGLEGGVSPCDLVAYQIGWGRLLLGWDAHEARGEVPLMPAPGFRWNQLGLLAQAFYRERQGQSLAQLLVDFAELVERLRSFIESGSEEFLFGIGVRRWTGPKWPLAKWIQVNTIAPYGSARARLRRWKKSQPMFQPPGVGSPSHSRGGP